jgi:hypothetical protein
VISIITTIIIITTTTKTTKIRMTRNVDSREAGT